jgi:inosose dehydratase
VRRIFGLTEIDFCPDTAHLAAAGGDPAELIREHASRISYIHLKGFQKEPFAFTPLDRGDVPTDNIIAAMRETNFAGWVCTELDAWGDPAAGARSSIDYLNQA